MAGSDWREAARGIPVEEEGRIYVWWHGGWVVDVVRHLEAAAGFFTGYRGGVAYGLHLAIPRLDHPGERAAYDRRLALALGAPVEAVSEGTRFYVDDTVPDSVGWALEAGGKIVKWWPRKRDFLLDSLETDDPLLARALAWPADKRVRE